MPSTITESGGEYDVAVVGAGAAGIAATRLLAAAGLRVVMLEARDRLGGRGHTVPSGLGFGVDLGCEWLHSADINPWTRLARDAGLTVDERLPDWGQRVAWLQGKAAQEEWRQNMAAFYDRLDRAAEEPVDRPAAALLEPGGKWNALLRAISNWANGAELDDVSVKDYGRYDPTNVNWRVIEGYGTLLAKVGADLPAQLGTVVERIDHGGKRINVVTNRGELSARAVVVTLPTNVIAAEAVRFSPALPDKISASGGLPLGVVNKLFLRIEGSPDTLKEETDRHLIGAIDTAETGSYQIRPHGWPAIEGFFGGHLAARFERDGAASMVDFARRELAGLFGADVARRLTPIAHSAWAADPFSRGAYSMARPGHAGDRKILAAPVDGRLFFAGEACSLAHFGTAHGAYFSAAEAAEQAIAALGSNRAGAASGGAPRIQGGI